MDWITFFNMFLTHKEIFFGFYEIMPSAIFNNAIQTNLFILIRKFADKYKRIPEFDTLLILLDNLPDSEKENKKDYVEFIDKVQGGCPKVDIDVFIEQLTKTIKDYEIEQFILRSANKVGSITLDDMVGDMREIMNKFTPKNMGIDITDVDRSVKYMRQDHSERFSTGVEELNRVLYGGYGVGEITIIMAPPGKGKSFFLLNANYYAMLAGKNTLYVTLEISEQAIIRRLYGRLAYASRKDLVEELVIAQRAKKFFKLAGASGRVIYYPGQTLTVAGLEALLEQQMLHFGFRTDVLIVDYLDRLSPRKSDYKHEVRHQLRNITDDLRSLAMKYGIQVISATQANRASLTKSKITEANVSESFGKIEVADVILALSQTEEEKLAKRAKILVLKNRDYISGSTILVYCDFEHMNLCDIVQAERLGLSGARVENPIVEREIK